MHPLTRDVIYATGLRREIAKPAIACVLLFLRQEVTAEGVTRIVDSLRQEVTAALRNSANLKAFERLVYLEEQGCSDVEILARELRSLGLSPSQILRLVDEILTHTETLAGMKDAKAFEQVLPALAEVFEHISEGPACIPPKR